MFQKARSFFYNCKLVECVHFRFLAITAIYISDLKRCHAIAHGIDSVAYIFDLVLHIIG